MALNTDFSLRRRDDHVEKRKNDPVAWITSVSIDLTNSNPRITEK